MATTTKKFHIAYTNPSFVSSHPPINTYININNLEELNSVVYDSQESTYSLGLQIGSSPASGSGVVQTSGDNSWCNPDILYNGDKSMNKNSSTALTTTFSGLNSLAGMVGDNKEIKLIFSHYSSEDGNGNRKSRITVDGTIIPEIPTFTIPPTCGNYELSTTSDSLEIIYDDDYLSALINNFSISSLTIEVSYESEVPDGGIILGLSSIDNFMTSQQVDKIYLGSVVAWEAITEKYYGGLIYDNANITAKFTTLSGVSSAGNRLTATINNGSATSVDETSVSRDFGSLTSHTEPFQSKLEFVTISKTGVLSGTKATTNHTSNTSATGTVSASFDGTNAWKAFDGNATGTYWFVEGLGNYIQYMFNAPITLGKYTFGLTLGNYNPSGWDLYGSNTTAFTSGTLISSQRNHPSDPNANYSYTEIFTAAKFQYFTWVLRGGSVNGEYSMISSLDFFAVSEGSIANTLVTDTPISNGDNLVIVKDNNSVNKLIAIGVTGSNPWTMDTTAVTQGEIPSKTFAVDTKVSIDIDSGWQEAQVASDSYVVAGVSLTSTRTYGDLESLGSGSQTLKTKIDFPTVNNKLTELTASIMIKD